MTASVGAWPAAPGTARWLPPGEALVVAPFRFVMPGDHCQELVRLLVGAAWLTPWLPRRAVGLDEITAGLAWVAPCEG